MLPRLSRIFFPQILRVTSLAVIVLLWQTDLFAQHDKQSVVCRAEVSQTHRDKLTLQLRKITGWADLHFDQGRLQPGTTQAIGGSQAARSLINKAIAGETFVALDDVSRNSDVVFSRVVPGKWTREVSDSPIAFVIQIDFADFDYVFGDAPALEAFNAGWVLLHELDHIVNDTVDATLKDELGECESHINRMRQECDLPRRSEYFFTFLPVTKDSLFNNRLARLAFDHQLEDSGKKKRYWLMWDATRVGGLSEQVQIAALR
ncbi:MAG TPA: hypothetical protein VFH31_13870 [Pyrinomonadaceae bacterium]|nr:hypothetical protein [Pyrinomonadaceae bacterium]